MSKKEHTRVELILDFIRSKLNLIQVILFSSLCLSLYFNMPSDISEFLLVAFFCAVAYSEYLQRCKEWEHFDELSRQKKDKS